MSGERETEGLNRTPSRDEERIARSERLQEGEAFLSPFSATLYLT